MSLKFNALVPPFDLAGTEGKEGKEGKTGPEGPAGSPKTAKAPLHVTGTEIELEEGKLTNGYIKAAAGIEDSKLALTTVVKLTGNQTVEGAKTFSGNCVITGSLVAEGPFQLGPVSNQEPPAENNNYKPPKPVPVLFIKPNSAETFITGIAEPFVGQALVIQNTATAQTLLLVHENAKTEESGHRFFFAGKKPVLLQARESIYLLYGPREKWEGFAGASASPWADSTTTEAAYPFMAPIVFGAKVENGTVNASARSENFSRIFLRGAAKIKALETLEEGETLMTLPINMRPSTAVHLDAGNAGVFAALKISTAGVVTVVNAAKKVAAGEEVFLDGITFQRV